MKKTLITSIISISCLFNLAYGQDNIPSPWWKGGDANKYTVALDETTSSVGNRSMLIESKKGVDVKNSFTSFGQNTIAKEYRGKRVQMSVYIKSEVVNGWTGAWFRIDAGNIPIGMDNMQSSARSITTAKDWDIYHIVMDIPQNADKIVFGGLLNGEGKAWFDGFSFDVVDETVEPTMALYPQSVIDKLTANKK